MAKRRSLDSGNQHNQRDGRSTASHRVSGTHLGQLRKLPPLQPDQVLTQRNRLVLPPAADCAGCSSSVPQHHGGDDIFDAAEHAAHGHCEEEANPASYNTPQDPCKDKTSAQTVRYLESAVLLVLERGRQRAQNRSKIKRTELGTWRPSGPREKPRRALIDTSTPL
jgi:hypothetical protein